MVNKTLQSASCGAELGSSAFRLRVSLRPMAGVSRLGSESVTQPRRSGEFHGPKGASRVNVVCLRSYPHRD